MTTPHHLSSAILSPQISPLQLYNCLYHYSDRSCRVGDPAGPETSNKRRELSYPSAPLLFSHIQGVDLMSKKRTCQAKRVTSKQVPQILQIHTPHQSPGRRSPLPTPTPEAMHMFAFLTITDTIRITHAWKALIEKSSYYRKC